MDGSHDLGILRAHVRLHGALLAFNPFLDERPIKSESGRIAGLKMAARICEVGFRDSSGGRHSVQVEAETL